MDPKRFHIEAGRLWVGDNPIPWAQTRFQEVQPEEEGGDPLFYCKAKIPFESGDVVFLDWSDGSYSDNFERRTIDGGRSPFVEDPYAVEISIAYADGTAVGGGIAQGWIPVSSALLILNSLAAPRHPIFTTGRYF